MPKSLFFNAFAPLGRSEEMLFNVPGCYPGLVGPLGFQPVFQCGLVYNCTFLYSICRVSAVFSSIPPNTNQLNALPKFVKIFVNTQKLFQISRNDFVKCQRPLQPLGNDFVKIQREFRFFGNASENLQRAYKISGVMIEEILWQRSFSSGLSDVCCCQQFSIFSLIHICCWVFRPTEVLINASQAIWSKKTADSNAPTCYLSVFSCNYCRFWLYLWQNHYYTTYAHESFGPVPMILERLRVRCMDLRIIFDHERKAGNHTCRQLCQWICTCSLYQTCPRSSSHHPHSIYNEIHDRS